MFNSSRINQLVQLSSVEYFDDQDLSALQFWMLIGIFISFLIFVLTVLSIIMYYDFFIENKNEFTEEHTTRFKDFKEMTGLEIELNDIRSILMNEFILEAWKREKHRQERHI
ncbi:unnamed protein product [Adineta steineri]|uniref:Uncharacterized protein n=1 Tax=Adineta steineri TaxID=433720 RepID=A0A818Y2E1_9BILA|nr:unnamed protein product [Adineta steineri]CAF1302899.1 unnamed protein product [Adineta steineri]CAF3685306.1 unnamed protein product [Adineta steineri]CAF3747113.1 unnamed protein product [Adineta steineri]